MGFRAGFQPRGTDGHTAQLSLFSSSSQRSGRGTPPGCPSIAPAHVPLRPPQGREPYLVGVRGGDDPHAVGVVLVLHRVVGGGDGAAGPPQVGPARPSCKHTEESYFRSPARPGKAAAVWNASGGERNSFLSARWHVGDAQHSGPRFAAATDTLYSSPCAQPFPPLNGPADASAMDNVTSMSPS